MDHLSERRRRWVVASLCGVVLLPMVVAAVVLARSPWWGPGGDEALISLHGWEAGSSASALGPYSRYGWNHPGPVLFWALALPARLFMDVGRGAAVGAILINAAAAVAAVWLVARRVGAGAAAGMVALVSLLVVTDPRGVWSVWNPDVTLLPFLACVVALWAVADGEVLAVPVAALAALFCVESHIGYASVLGAMAVACAVMGLVRWWRRGRPVPTRRSWVILGATAVASAIVLWPMVSDQVSGTGNLGLILDYFTSPARSTVGLGEAVGQLARQLAPWGPWVGGREPVSLFGGGTAVAAPSWWLVAPSVGVGLAVVAAWWRRDTTMLRLLVLVVVGCVVGLWSVASITPPAFPYLFVWLHVVAALLWATVLLTLVRAMGTRRDTTPARPGLVVTAATVVVLVLVPVGVAATSVSRSELPYPEEARAAEAMLPATLAAVPEGAGFSISSPVPFTRVVEALGAQLIEHDRRIVVDADHALAWGRSREGDVEDPSLVQLAVLVGSGSEWATPPAGWTTLARWTADDDDTDGLRLTLVRRGS